MPKRKAEIRAQPKAKLKMNIGLAALLGLFILSAVDVYVTIGTIGPVLIALLGVVMAYKHIAYWEENEFLISVTAFTLTAAIMQLFLMGAASEFVSNVTIGFAAAGFFVALGKIVKLGLTR